MSPQRAPLIPSTSTLPPRQGTMNSSSKRPMDLAPIESSSTTNNSQKMSTTKKQTAFNITPKAQMILTDTSTMIFQTDPGMKTTQLVSSHSGNEKKSYKATLIGGERKKSIGSNSRQTIQNSKLLKNMVGEKSPYVSQETAALLKQQLVARRSSNNRSVHNSSSGNMLNTMLSKSVTMSGHTAGKRLKRNLKNGLSAQPRQADDELTSPEPMKVVLGGITPRGTEIKNENSIGRGGIKALSRQMSVDLMEAADSLEIPSPTIVKPKKASVMVDKNPLDLSQQIKDQLDYE